MATRRPASAGTAHGTDYALRRSTAASRSPDPRSAWQPDGVHGPSRGRSTRPPSPGPTATGAACDAAPARCVYELHVGTFTAEGTLDAAVERLDHLVDLGVDVVELMPVARSPARTAGATTASACTPCTSRTAARRPCSASSTPATPAASASCLDVVYNHLGPSGNYLRASSARTSPTRTARRGDRRSTSTTPGSDEVRRFIVDNALRWLRDFHVDGLRLDAVHALHDDSPRTPAGGAVRRGRRAVAPSWAGRCGWSPSPTSTTRAWSTPTAEGGLGHDAQWADDVHHALHVALTGETHGYYADFAAARPRARQGADRGVPPRRHATRPSAARHGRAGRPARATPAGGSSATLQTHDQVGNRAPATGCRRRSTPGLLAVGAALVLLARRSRRCCSWARSGAPRRRGSSSPTTTSRARRGGAPGPAGRVRRARLGRRGRRPRPAGPRDLRRARCSTGTRLDDEPHGRDAAVVHRLHRLRRDLLAAGPDALRRRRRRPTTRTPAGW